VCGRRVVEQSDKKMSAGTVLALDASGLRVACGDGVLLLTELQLPNRNRMTVRELVNGHLLHLQAGDQLA
jgi:methionyl-tRNA formyltransferase